MMNPFITIKELKEKIDKKEISSGEVIKFYLERIKKYNPKLNSVLESFDLSDIPAQSINSNEILGGVPYLLKDNILQKGRTATGGSKILSNYVAAYDSTVNYRLKRAGAVSIGRTNCDEFAMSASGETSAFGPTRNPWDEARVPGGSSSGSAAAVAAGLIPFALGTETGGSVRQPASFCNLVGLYPTYGLHSRYGVMAFASSFDQVGPLTHTVYDNALVTTALSGVDVKDSTTIQNQPKDYTKNLDGRLPENLTIGVIKDALEAEGINPEISLAFNQAIVQLKKLGAKVKIVELPHLKYGNAIYFIISRAEAASNLSRYDGSLYGNRVENSENLFDMYLKTRENGFGREVKLRIMTGNYVLSAGHKDAYYNKAQAVRAMLRQEFDTAFKDVDLLISPTSSMLPFKIGELASDPIAMYLGDLFTVPNCVIGTPGLSIPCGFSKSNLPIGFQFLGPRLSEELIYKVAYAFEQGTDYHTKHPGNYE
jgi:aspartyl-tRNA(Asn)/glutamyl-tRNA(Gln) amidotransferase subunit A